MNFVRLFLVSLLLPTLISNVLADSKSLPTFGDDACERLLNPQLVPSAEVFRSSVSTKVVDVAEFRFLRELCERLDVRCWLFGGTAAGFAHYVKWDLQSLAGDARYQRDRFDYDYVNIYRSTQDADLVIDGNETQAAQIEEELKDRFPHLQGGKSVWEVRMLRSDRGDKAALLDNPDFLNQHTDSNSTGMIEVTQPETGESVVRDIRDWFAGNDRDPIFLQDILAGKLHFYFSSNHDQTKRAKEGKNPPILSAIRYLTKAFQYELQILPEDEVLIREIIRNFKPDPNAYDYYVRGWVSRNGKKIFQHAVNLEYAWNRLDELGLRTKLMQWDSAQKGIVGSLHTWMNREPLRTKPLGAGDGQTARNLGLSIVAHETSDFLAYESITRAHTGDPNVFKSRKVAPGEAAVFGEGVYAALGTQGAKGTGITIRFMIHPDARRGEDFLLFRPKEGGNGFVVFLNKAAFRVIPESMEISPASYFRLMVDEKFLATERAMLMKFKRKVSAQMRDLDDEDIAEIAQVVRDSVQKVKQSERHQRKNDLLTLFEFLNATAEDEHPGLRLLHGEVQALLLERFVRSEGLGEDRDSQAKQGEIRMLIDSGLLGAISLTPEWREAALRFMLNAPDRATLLDSYVILAQISRRDPEVITRLLEWFLNPTLEGRRRIPAALLKIDPSNPVILKALFSSLRDDVPDVQVAILEAFEKAPGITVGDGVSLILELAQSRFGRIRVAASKVLKGIVDQRSDLDARYSNLLLNGLLNFDSAVRSYSITQLESAFKQDQTVREAYLRSLEKYRDIGTSLRILEIYLKYQLQVPIQDPDFIRVVTRMSKESVPQLSLFARYVLTTVQSSKSP